MANEREDLAKLIRSEIKKGWDFPLSATPESQSGAAADAILAAGFRRIPEPDAAAIESLTADLAASGARVATFRSLLIAWMEFYGAEEMDTETVVAANAALAGTAAQEEK